MKTSFYTYILSSALLSMASYASQAANLNYANYQVNWFDMNQPINTVSNLTLTCPATYPRAISGVCGERDAVNSNVGQALVVTYSGPLRGSEGTTWRCGTTNVTSTTRVIRYGVVCGK